MKKQRFKVLSLLLALSLAAAGCGKTAGTTDSGERLCRQCSGG